jgi:hypothetical protein
LIFLHFGVFVSLCFLVVFMVFPLPLFYFLFGLILLFFLLFCFHAFPWI